MKLWIFLPGHISCFVLMCSTRQPCSMLSLVDTDLICISTICWHCFLHSFCEQRLRDQFTQPWNSRIARNFGWWKFFVKMTISPSEEMFIFIFSYTPAKCGLFWIQLFGVSFGQWQCLLQVTSVLSTKWFRTPTLINLLALASKGCLYTYKPVIIWCN